MPPLERIPLADLSPKEFAARYRTGQGRPVVITGALDGLPPATLEWISSRLPPAKLSARFYGKDHFQKPKSEWKKYSELLQLLPSEYADLLTNRTAHTDNIYMAQVAIGETELGDLMRPRMTALADRTGLRAAIDLNLWWGPGGHTEPLHYDSGDGTLVQLHGVKKAVLFPPAQTKNLYPFPVRRKGIAPWISRVYIDKPDFDAFPRMREALQHKIEVLLAPGEVLFIPANWWHEVSALSDDYVCSVNRFWKVAPITRLFTNNISPWVYGISMIALALMRKKVPSPLRGEGEGEGRISRNDGGETPPAQPARTPALQHRRIGTPASRRLSRERLAPDLTAGAAPHPDPLPGGERGGDP